MQQRTKSLIFIAVGLIGFLGFTLFSGGPSSSAIEACKQVVTAQSPSSPSDVLLKQCETDNGFVIMMTSGSIDPQSIASSNRYEVLFSLLRWFSLGLAVAGVLGLFIKKKK